MERLIHELGLVQNVLDKLLSISGGIYSREPNCFVAKNTVRSAFQPFLSSNPAALMARYLQCLLFVWYFFVVTVTRAEQPVAFNHGFLYGRADGDSDPSDPGLQCTRFCEVSVGSQGPRSLDRRFNSPCGLNHASARNVNQPLFLGIDGNENATESRLAKRAFPENIDNNEDAAKYVIGVLTGPSPPDGFFATGTPAAVQYMRKFEDKAFSYGTAGLHGCTMVAIISKRAVYIAHFWETYSTHGDDVVTGNSRQQFLERVVNALKGVPVASPYNPPEASNKNDRIARNHRYVPPVGDPIDFSLFDREGDDGDNSMMYIMTPVKAGREEDSTDFEYKKKYEQVLGQEIRRRGRIRGCGIAITGYKRLVYKINQAGQPEKAEGHEDDWEEFVNPKHAKGMALFEYDGKDTWRLFWENKYETGKVYLEYKHARYAGVLKHAMMGGTAGVGQILG
ncbi:hypothetical protein P171DRAFT_441729 [Karstenula rhodostoma CBS 690.94]|uniref:Uncharacterized protein n=1 Tax=Karstenula rhodostoma CBS 690.94 TaxID=1392251 RepID=A0A9P4PPF3_9PLEO|nr:hypothetical protein P171DRAFT_441729 [Karstenula rhodostoma CBS 690.94]